MKVTLLQDDHLRLQNPNCRGKSLKTAVDIIEFIWPITLEKVLQIGIFGGLVTGLDLTYHDENLIR